MSRVVVVTGPRSANRDVWSPIVERALREALGGSRSVLIHGDANGIDKMCAKIVLLNSKNAVLSFPADWDYHGKGAGHIRNKAMADTARTMQNYGHEVSVCCFCDDLDQTKGTKSMVETCHKLGLTVYQYRSDGTCELLHNPNIPF